MDISGIQKAISGESLDGWLFFNFLHRDAFSDKLLEIDCSRMNTRPWYYLVPAKGEPRRICHRVEPHQLDHLPGSLSFYSSREELLSLLGNVTAEHGPDWGAQYSAELTTISTLDHGTALMLEQAGMKLCSSVGLIQRLGGLLDQQGISLHEEAAAHLYEIVRIVWGKITDYFHEAGHKAARSRLPLLETDVQKWILDEFRSRGMVTEHMPVAASGPASGDPHYAAELHSNPVLPDSIFQLDIWAKMDKPGGIFADISWVGYTGAAVPEEAAEMFAAVRAARDRCLSFINGKLEEGRCVRGSDADRAAREVLINRGFESLIKHRTGHGIDTEVHGSGAGLDSVEFPDNRPLLEGSCFSIEPGLYSSRFGMRTEIDAYISGGRLKVSGGPIQTGILTIW